MSWRSPLISKNSCLFSAELADTLYWEVAKMAQNNNNNKNNPNNRKKNNNKNENKEQKRNQKKENC
jgi:hypothetical protein